MKSFIKQLLIFIAQLIAIIVLSFVLAPYLTAENYTESSEIASSFPVAIQRNDKYEIVRWRKYKESPEEYKNLLITEPENKNYSLPKNRFFKMEKTGHNIYKVTHYDDNYTFWAEYSITNGLVTPIHFRFIGAFIVMPAVLLILLTVLIINIVSPFFVVWYSKKRGVQKAAAPAPE